MNLICHKACPDHGPENTVEAVENLHDRVDMIEIDVQRCGTGELVVFHDTTLHDLTGGTAAVAATSWEQLRTYTVGDSGASIPLLSTLLDAVPDDVGIHVELKHAGMAPDILPVVTEVENELVFSSFTPQAIVPFEQQGYDTAHLVHPVISGAWSEELDAAVSLGCAYIHPRYNMVDSDRVAAAHDRGLTVNAWTVPDAETVDELKTAGVDGVMIDDWCLLKEAP